VKCNIDDRRWGLWRGLEHPLPEVQQALEFPEQMTVRKGLVLSKCTAMNEKKSVSQ
jgi:hypothetical protein